MSDTDMRATLDRLPRWWPVIAAFVVVIAAGVRVQANVETVDRRVASLEATSADMRDRLARMEERQKSTYEGVKRIEGLIAR